MYTRVLPVLNIPGVPSGFQKSTLHVTLGPKVAQLMWQIIGPSASRAACNSEYSVVNLGSRLYKQVRSQTRCASACSMQTLHSSSSQLPVVKPQNIAYNRAWGPRRLSMMDRHSSTAIFSTPFSFATEPAKDRSISIRSSKPLAGVI